MSAPTPEHSAMTRLAGTDVLSPTHLGALQDLLGRATEEEALALQYSMHSIAAHLLARAGRATLDGEFTEAGGDKVLASAEYGQAEGLTVSAQLVDTFGRFLGERLLPITVQKNDHLTKPRTMKEDDGTFLREPQTIEQSWGILLDVGLDSDDVRQATMASPRTIAKWFSGDSLPRTNSVETVRRIAIVVDYLKVELDVLDTDIVDFLRLSLVNRETRQETPILRLLRFPGGNPGLVLSKAKIHFKNYKPRVE